MNIIACLYIFIEIKEEDVGRKSKREGENK
jgi:hypothetical protein